MNQNTKGRVQGVNYYQQNTDISPKSLPLRVENPSKKNQSLSTGGNHKRVGTNLTRWSVQREPRHIRCRGHSSKPPRESNFSPSGTSRINTNTQAELSAIHRGLQLCRDKGFRKIWIETDAKAIITLISSPRQGAWNLQNTLQRIRNILSQMTYRISHIFREGNQAADFLANQACSEQQLCILQEDDLIGKAK
ncbi:UNVERIFIED_CONTAM: hypothetical protein Sangu_3229600, partial [Sesamum angustifolium]